MRRLVYAVLIVWALVFVVALAQTPAPASGVTEVTPKSAHYDSTKAQLLTEKNKNLQLQFQLLQQQYQQQQKTLQDQYNDNQKALTEWTEQVRRENDWGVDVTWDAVQDKWYRSPPAKKPESGKKPEEAKPEAAVPPKSF